MLLKFNQVLWLGKKLESLLGAHFLSVSKV